MSAKLKSWVSLLRVVCFLLLFAFLFRQATLVLRPNWTGGGCFYDEPADSLDVLFCGSSRMLNGVSPLRLYELLERLECRDFLRAGKSSILNLRQVQSLRPEFGGRLRCTMANGEVLLVSRQYVPSVKERLGI